MQNSPANSTEPGGLDNPFALEVIRITKLENGYVLNAMGKTTACETPSSLARQVKRWAEEVERRAGEFLGLKFPAENSPIPSQPEQWRGGEVIVDRFAIPTDMIGETSPVPTPEEWAESLERAREEQRSQLRLLIDNLFDDTIDEDTFYRGTRIGCPDLSGEEIGDALDQAHQEYNSGTIDATDHERIERLRNRVVRDTGGNSRESPNEVPLVQLRSAEEDAQGQSPGGGESGRDSEGSRAGLSRDGVDESGPGESDISVGDVPAEPAAGPRLVRQRRDMANAQPTNQGRLRPARRRPLLEPGTWSDPKPEDVDKFDEEWPG